MKTKKSPERDVNLAPWQALALTNEYRHFAMLCGIAVGKTFTGAHFAIKQIIERPDLTGLIAANSYDQLSQATMRELMFWLDTYEIPYVTDRIPPKEWGNIKKEFKSYRNIMSVLIGETVATIFTRVLADGDALRGIEFSWYWLDETRDTPSNTHDIILSRMRESDYVKGLITTTTNGEDWCYDRFVKNAASNDNTFGSMHVSTRESVSHGIVTQEFLDTLLKSYSPMMVAQEIDALHVNVNTGRAYYAADEDHAMERSPWGDLDPDPDRSIVLTCDFNFSPAPLTWEVGQLSPDGESIHWFQEFSEVEISTVDMAARVASQFGDFFIEVYGDASGEHGTSSNAGVTDFNQIAGVFDECGIGYSINTRQSNPRVRDRIENANRMLKNGAGERHMTYSRTRCPLLDKDLRLVGWKQTDGKGKLDSNGDVTRTHASDAVGYALMKIFPPRRDVLMPGGNVGSANRAALKAL